MNISKQILHSQLLSGVSVLLNFLKFTFLVRILSPEHYGVFVLVLGALAFSQYFLGLNLYSYTKLKIPGSEENVQLGYLKTNLTIVLSWTTAVVLIGYLIGPESISYLLFNEDSYFWYFAPLVFVNIVYLELVRFHLSTKKIYAKNYADFIKRNTYSLAICTIYFFVDSLEVWNVLVLLLIADTVSCTFLLLKIPFRKFFNSTLKIDVLSKGLKIALLLLPSTLSYIALNYSDKFMISKMIGSMETGLYGFNFNIILLFIGIIEYSITLNFFPFMMEAHNKGKNMLRDYYLTKNFRLSIFASFLFLLFVGGNSQLIVSVIGGPKYAETFPILIVLCSYPILRVATSISSNFLQVRGNFKIQSISFVSGLILNVGLNYFVIPKYGVIGAAYASIASFTLIALLITTQLGKYFDWKRLSLKSLRIGLIFVGVFILVQYASMFEQSLISFAIFNTLAILLVVLLVWSKWIIPIKDLLAFLRR